MEKTNIEKIFKKWEAEWKDEQNILFKDLFLETYNKSKHKMKKNRTQNFISKIVFLGIIIVGIVLMGIIGKRCYDEKITIADCTMLAVVILFATVLISGLIAKWIDIMKYQETWARHSLNLHNMETEVVKYVYQLAPYNCPERNNKFINRTLEVWDINQKIFSENMTKNESALMNYFKNIRKIMN